MSQRKVFTVIAGINGAGKTSLYHVLKHTDDLGRRVNIDELAKRSENWRDPRVQIQAGREAMAMIMQYIKDGTSFHLETTLPGITIVRQIQEAKAHGFFIYLYFVGIDDIQVAIDRVHNRMSKGGHGIGDSFILKRFSQLNRNLTQILPLCDGAILFDNTVKFRQIAILENKRFIDCDHDLPMWFIDLMDTMSQAKEKNTL